MADTGTEYSLIYSLLFFIILSSLCFSFLGMGQLHQFDTTESVNVYTGFKFFFTNPFTDIWSKFIFSLVILIPLGSIITMISYNAIRGR